MDDTRETKHIQLVAYLQVIGINQCILPTLRGNAIYFHFKDTPELKAEIEKFYLRQTSVDALTVLEVERTLINWATMLKKSKEAGKGGGIDGTN
jgi:hypothetical protein